MKGCEVYFFSDFFMNVAVRSLVSGYEGMFILADVLQKGTREPFSSIFAILANFCFSSIGFRLFTLNITCEALSPALPKLRR